MGVVAYWRYFGWGLGVAYGIGGVGSCAAEFCLRVPDCAMLALGLVCLSCFCLVV